MAKLTGYVIRDRAGVCSVVTGTSEEFDHVRRDYVRANRILEEEKPNPGEDETDFRIRIAGIAEIWQKRLKFN